MLKPEVEVPGTCKEDASSMGIAECNAPMILGPQQRRGFQPHQQKSTDKMGVAQLTVPKDLKRKRTNTHTYIHTYIYMYICK